MLINILQENLLKTLIRACRIIPSKPQIPILQNILLSGEDGVLKVVSTSIDTTEVSLVGAKVEKAGGICVSSRLLLEFVSSLPQSTVRLTEKDGALIIQCEGYKATIPGVSEKEFPPISELDTKNASVIQTEKIMEATESVVFAAATDEGRPILSGVKIIQRDNETLFAATDGYRLSVKKIDIKTKEESGLLIPARALSEVIKLCQEEKAVKEVRMTRPKDGQIAFIVGDTELRTRLIEGEYPNFEKIIPTKFNTRVLCEKDVLLRAVRSSAIFAKDSANIIRFHIEKQTLTVSANTPAVGENETDVEVKVDGEGGDIAFNSRFVIEFLSNCKEDEVLFEMTGSLNPGVFRPPKDESFLHVIMPVRVQGAN